MSKQLEKFNLVVAGVSGEIYLARLDDIGFMSDTRKVMTEECLRATTEWFMKNKKKAIAYGSVLENSNPHLFFTDDKEKAKKIIEILKE